MSEIFLKAPKGSTKNKKRVGRGQGSGRGCTSGKGNKGQNARSGGGVRPGFEGGQMPLFRRIARRGFSNHDFKRPVTVINLRDLAEFKAEEIVNKETLIKRGLIKKNTLFVKLLSKGEIATKLTISVDRISQKAKEKIEKAGGSVAVTNLISKKKKKRVKKEDIKNKKGADVKEKAKKKNERNEEKA